MSATAVPVDVWAHIAAPLPPDAIGWRQDGRPAARGNGWVARFVAFIDAQFVRSRLDDVVPGQWETYLELLPSPAAASDEAQKFAFKCRLDILGVTREDVGEGDDFKTAATDAFKRAAVRFGIGAELYAYGPNWVKVDSDSKYAKPIEDPSEAYARQNGGALQPAVSATSRVPSRLTTETAESTAAPQRAPEKRCPKCDGPMYNNVAENDMRVARGEKMRPDYKCKKTTCDGLIWREKVDVPKAMAGRERALANDNDFPPALEDEQDNLPF